MVKQYEGDRKMCDTNQGGGGGGGGFTTQESNSMGVKMILIDYKYTLCGSDHSAGYDCFISLESSRLSLIL